MAELERLKTQAKIIADTARRARTSIVRRVFNDSLNKLWRDLFVRLAPTEPYVPAFRIPESDVDAIAKLETIHRTGKRGSSYVSNDRIQGMPDPRRPGFKLHANRRGGGANDPLYPAGLTLIRQVNLNSLPGRGVSTASYPCIPIEVAVTRRYVMPWLRQGITWE